MATFEELKQLYMFSGSGITTHQNCTIEPLIFDAADRKEYFQALRDEINRPGVEFVYITGWWLDPTFSLDGPLGTTLVDLLKAKSAAGVEVRVLAWVMPPEVIRHPQVQALGGSILRLNSESMCFINRLRAEPSLANKACLNILSHPAGAVHTKMAIVGGGAQAVGFTGGIDLEGTRLLPIWHDVQAKATGPVVQGFFDTFRAMWNEVRGRPPAAGLAASAGKCGPVTCDSHTTSMPGLPARAVASTSTGTMHAQSVRTFPQFNLAGSSSAGIASVTLPGNSPLSFASSGLFEVRDVWQKAVSGAQRYVYIEDQGFTANEVFDWINARIRASTDLRVILVIGGNDPTVPSPPTTLKAMNVAINSHLLAGLSAPQVTNQVGFFMYRTSKFVHTKSTILDDAWAIIGSANCMRRSLYTDVEHSVAYMDEAGVGVPNYRTKLWARHLQTGIPDLATAIARWFAIPFKGSGAPNPLDLDRVPLFPIGASLAGTSLTSDEQTEMDELQDVDSRQRWGAKIVPMFMKAAGRGSLVGSSS